MEESLPLRLAGVIRESVVDGPGYRFVVFTQGCPHRCEGCHNPETHDFEGGYASSTGRILTAIRQDPLLRGVTFSGGEPFCQAEPLALLARQAHGIGLDVMCYTGYTYEQLLDGVSERPEWLELLRETDILADGPFLQTEKSLSLRFRGSKNQRIIHPRRSLEEGRVVELSLD